MASIIKDSTERCVVAKWQWKGKCLPNEDRSERRMPAVVLPIPVDYQMGVEDIHSLGTKREYVDS